MILRQNLEDILTKLEQNRKIVNMELAACPPGQLMQTTYGNVQQYFHVYECNSKRVRRSIRRNPGIIAALARKKYLETQLQMIENDIAVIQKALRQFTAITADYILQNLPRSYRKLPQDLFFQGAEDPLSSWGQEPYKQSSYMPERKIHLTSRGLRVRSKSEVLISEKLYELGVPFRYEQILAIGKYELSPDFTVLSKSGKIFYWEHCGMPGNQEYMKRHKWKMNMYETADIVPWKNLIVTYDNENGTIDLAIIDGEIRNKLL